jgi:hypothetical protein
VTISADQFTWITQTRVGISTYTGPLYLRIAPGEEVVFRFTPLPGLRLGRVEQLSVRSERGSGFIRHVPLQLWHWRLRRWVDVEGNNNTIVIDDPEAFIGPQNAVQLRLYLEESGGYIDVGNLSVEQKGNF